MQRLDLGLLDVVVCTDDLLGHLEADAALAGGAEGLDLGLGDLGVVVDVVSGMLLRAPFLTCGGAKWDVRGRGGRRWRTYCDAIVIVKSNSIC